MTATTTATIETFNTVKDAVETIRFRVWGQRQAKGCACKYAKDGACKTYTFNVGHITWTASFDNYGRATTQRA